MKLSLHVMPVHLRPALYRAVHDQPEGDRMRQHRDDGCRLPAGMALTKSTGTMLTITSRSGTQPSNTQARVMLEIRLSVFQAPVRL